MRQGISRHTSRGHTLVELLVAFGIIMILIGIVLTSMIKVIRLINTWRH